MTRLDVQNRAGDRATVDPDAGFVYTRKLNEIKELNMKFSGTSTVKRGLFQNGSIVWVYEGGVLDSKYIVHKVVKLSGGGLSVEAAGQEILLSDENFAYNTSGTATASATILASVIGASTDFSAGTIAAGSSIHFRASQSQSLWQSIRKITEKTGQDVHVDYTNTEIDVVDHEGSSTSVMVLNEGVEITNLQKSEGRPLGNKVVVYGKGDGENQIKSDVSTYGIDAGSQSTYGVIEYPYIDRTIMSESEANTLADKIVAYTALETEVYDFDVLNPGLSVSEGDVITLNAPSFDVNATDVRVVGVERGREGTNSFLRLQVTNVEYSKLVKGFNDELARLSKKSLEDETFMQGDGSMLTWSAAMNAKSGAGLRRVFALPAGLITDEAGNIRIASLTVDWDVDPYRSEFGTVSESNIAPSLSAGSADSHGHSPTDAGHVHTVSSPTTDTSDIWDSQGIDSDDNISVGTGFATFLGVTLTAGSYSVFWVRVRIRFGFGDTIPDPVIYWRVDTSGFSAMDIEDNRFIEDDGITIDVTYMMLPLASVGSSDSIDLSLKGSTSCDCDVNLWVYSMPANHSHNVSALTGTQQAAADVSDSNVSPGLAGNAASHNHSAIIGDDVDDSGSVNASSVTVYLDFWNGSIWVNKVTSAGQALLATDFDITDGGTYPDAAGFWRVVIEPDSASPDFVQCIVRLKHVLEN